MSPPPVSCPSISFSSCSCSSHARCKGSENVRFCCLLPFSSFLLTPILNPGKFVSCPLVLRSLQFNEAPGVLQTLTSDRPSLTTSKALSNDTTLYLVIQSALPSASNRAFFYGDISAKTDPELYLRCVVALYDDFRWRHYDVTSKEKRVSALSST
jgi:hypothetical protein